MSMKSKLENVIWNDVLGSGDINAQWRNFKGKRKGTPLWGTHRLQVLQHYGLRLQPMLLVQPLISYEFPKLLICRRRHKFTRQSKMANMREICVLANP